MITHSINIMTLCSLNFSLGDQLQAYVIQLHAYSRYRVIRSLGARLIALPGMLITRIIDMTLHLFLGLAKLFAGVILLPVHMTSHVLYNKKWDTEWTVKQGCLHIGKAILFGVDALASPCVNLIDPDLNGQTWRFRNKEQEFEEFKLKTNKQIEEFILLAPTIKEMIRKWQKAQSDLKQAYNQIFILKEKNQQLQENTNQLSSQIFGLTKECLDLKTEL